MRAAVSRAILRRCRDLKGHPLILCLHIPGSVAHLDELRDRLASHLGSTWHACESTSDQDLIETLLDVVRAMDRGDLTPMKVDETFTRYGFPSFGQWLRDMLDEDVYLHADLRRVA